MTIVTSARNYRIESNSISMLENALEDNNKVMVSCVHNATITVYDREAGILPTSDARYRTWRMVARNTRLAHRGLYHIYARLNRNTGTGEYIFSQKDYNIDGSLKGDPDSGEQASYWYILVGEITATDEDAPAPGTVPREIVMDFGILNTALEPPAIEEELQRDIQEVEKEVSEKYLEMIDRFGKMGDDNYITPSEKRAIYIQWNNELSFRESIWSYDESFYDDEDFMEAVSDYDDIIERASYIILREKAGIKKGILADTTSTTDVREIPFEDYGFKNIRDMWTSIFSARSYVESTSPYVAKKAADNANTRLADMASDLVITAQEKLELYRWWNQSINNYDSLCARAKSVHIDETQEPYLNLTKAFKSLASRITVILSNLGKDTRMTEEQAKDYKTKILNFISATATLETAILHAVTERINSIVSEGVTEDIKKQLDSILAEYENMSDTFTKFTNTYGAIFTQGELGPEISTQVIGASGLVTTADYVSLFSTAKGPDGKTLADALVATYVSFDPEDNTKVMSGVTMGADQIDFKGKSINISAENNLTISARNGSNVEYFHLDEDKFTIDTKGLKLDANGNAVFSGDINGASGIFRGFVKPQANIISASTNIDLVTIPTTKDGRKTREFILERLGRIIQINSFDQGGTNFNFPEDEVDIDLMRGMVGQSLYVVNKTANTIYIGYHTFRKEGGTAIDFIPGGRWVWVPIEGTRMFRFVVVPQYVPVGAIALEHYAIEAQQDTANKGIVPSN